MCGRENRSVEYNFPSTQLLCVFFPQVCSQGVIVGGLCRGESASAHFVHLGGEKQCGFFLQKVVKFLVYRLKNTMPGAGPQTFKS